MLIEKHVTLRGLSIRVCMSGIGDSAILFVHGNSCSADYYREQLGDPFLAEKYQLISFDLPGHGQSQRGEDYSLKELAALIPALAEHLSLDRYILSGLSFGTNLIGEAAPALPGCRGVLLASPAITNDANPPASFIRPNPEAYALGSPVVPDEILSGFSRLMVYEQDSPLIEEYIRSYLHTDPAFRAAVGKAILGKEWDDEWANLTGMGVPACIVFGREEKLTDPYYTDSYPLKWGEQIYRIEDAAHLVNLEQPEAFNRILGLFAEDMLG